MTKIIKEIIVMLLVCLATMLIFAIVLYEYIPGKKQVPEIATYVATEQVQDLLEDTVDQKKDEDRIIFTYEVTKGDLAGYQTTKDYVPGKTNPFAEFSSETSGEPADNVAGNSGENNNNFAQGENKDATISNPSVYKDQSGK